MQTNYFLKQFFFFPVTGLCYRSFQRVLLAGYQKILFGSSPKKYFNRDFVNSIFLLQPCKVT